MDEQWQLRPFAPHMQVRGWGGRVPGGVLGWGQGRRDPSCLLGEEGENEIGGEESRLAPAPLYSDKSVVPDLSLSGIEEFLGRDKIPQWMREERRSRTPPMVNRLSLWGSAMFGADAVEEALGYVGAVLGPALPHPGVVAAEPLATPVGGSHGGPPGHESDSSSTSSESSGSCDSSDSDVRIIAPPAGKGPPPNPAFRIGTAERPTAQGNGGGAGRRKRKRPVPPTTVRG